MPLLQTHKEKPYEEPLARRGGGWGFRGKRGVGKSGCFSYDMPTVTTPLAICTVLPLEASTAYMM
jgi:hypothetical protein